MSRRLIALIVGALAVGLIAGCGSGDDGDSSTSSLTKAEFIKQADAVCAKGKEQIEAAYSAYLKENEGAKGGEADLFAVVLIPRLRKEVEEIRAFGAPAGDEKEVNGIVDAFAAGVAEAEDDSASLVNGSTEFDTADKLAKKYGLKVCVQT